MNDLKRDMMRIQELIGNAFRQTGSLVALTDGGQMNPNKLQKTLEQTMEQFEAATLELRKLCERYAPGSGGFAKKPILPSMDVTGSVEAFGYGWLHITINTLLPHCRYQSPNWLSDTIRRLLDSYEACGKELPFFERAMLIIDEHTAIFSIRTTRGGRRSATPSKEDLFRMMTSIRWQSPFFLRQCKARSAVISPFCPCPMLMTFSPHIPVTMPPETSISVDGADGQSR